MRIAIASAIAVLCLSSYPSARDQDVPAPYQAVLSTLGRTGDFKDGVLKVNLPRTDLKVTINGRAMPTALGFGGWVALTSGDMGESVMMGDFVLTEDQVNPVMSAVLDNGLEATALHNHFFWESPRLFYMHVHGHGTPADLAKRVQPAIDLFVFNSITEIDPAIVAEFAHVVYRFGHSMLDEQVQRTDVTTTGLSDNNIGLIEAFLNPSDTITCPGHEWSIVEVDAAMVLLECSKCARMPPLPLSVLV